MSVWLCSCLTGPRGYWEHQQADHSGSAASGCSSVHSARKDSASSLGAPGSHSSLGIEKGEHFPPPGIPFSVVLPASACVGLGRICPRRGSWAADFSQPQVLNPHSPLNFGATVSWVCRTRTGEMGFSDEGWFLQSQKQDGCSGKSNSLSMEINPQCLFSVLTSLSPEKLSFLPSSTQFYPRFFSISQFIIILRCKEGFFLYFLHAARET